MVYPVTSTGADATISAVGKWIQPFGILQSIVHDRGTAFIETEFVNWTKGFGITLRPRTAHSPWTNEKIETQNQHIVRHWRNFLNNAGNIWSSLAPNFAFAHKNNVNYTIGKTPYEIVFDTKPQIPMSLKLGLYSKKHEFCCSELCKSLPSPSLIENKLKNQLLDNLLRLQFSHALLERGHDFKRISSATCERCREQTARSHAYRNWFMLGQHLRIGQKVLYENHRQHLCKSQKFRQRRFGHFTVTKKVASTTYQIQDDRDNTIFKTLHRSHLVEYQPKEETLPPMIKNMCLWIAVMIISTKDWWSNEFSSYTTPNNLAWKTLSHLLLNLFVHLRLHFHRNELVILAVTLELTLLMSYHRQSQ